MSRNTLEEALESARFMRAVARAGTFRRAARELAHDESEQGFWLEDEDATGAAADEPMRLAAQDAVVFESGEWRIEMRQRGDGAEFTLVSGREGASLRLGTRIVPLARGVALVVTTGEPIERIVLLDVRGREVVLPRKG